MLKIIAYINKEDIKIPYDIDLSGIHAKNVRSIIQSNYANCILLDMTYATTQSHLLSIIGEMVEIGEIDKNDVVVFMVKEDDIFECQFDDEGYMVGGWEYGFFSS